MANEGAASSASELSAQQSLDAKIARGRAEHDCLKKLDELMYCISTPPPPSRTTPRTLTHDHTPPRAAGVTNQFGKYYRDGTYDDCPRDFKQWRSCLSAKLKKKEAAEAIYHEEWARRVQGHHIFRFRHGYADEARRRYGVLGPDEESGRASQPEGSPAAHGAGGAG
jgi:hypothetical protein